MTFLVLDLDETVFYVDEHAHYIHPKHRSWGYCTFEYPHSHSLTRTLNLRIINPVELTDLITQALARHSGVIILTSGLWPRDILKVIANQLPLRPELKPQFINSSFYSPIEECQYWLEQKYITKVRSAITQGIGMSEKEITFWNDVGKDNSVLMREWIRHKLSKNTRLEQIIQAPSEAHRYSGHDFVLLDNDLKHINSFINNPRVKAVHAATDSEREDFYDIAQALLIELEQLEPVAKLTQSDSLDSVLEAALEMPSEGSPFNPASGLRTLGLFREMEYPASVATEKTTKYSQYS